MRFIFLIFKNKFTIKSFFSIFFGKITPFESWMVFTHFGKIFKNEVKNEFRFSAAQNFLNISESENLSAISLSNDITKTEAKSIFTGYNAFEQLRYKPFVGLFNYANQNLPFAKINKYGFQHSSLNISKKINTKRVIIIGGSAAFGYGSSDPTKTLTSYFEKHLNKNQFSQNNKLNWEVINLSFMASQSISEMNLLNMYCPVLSPDYVIHLSGYNDLFYYLNSKNKLFQFNGSENIYNYIYSSNIQKLINFLSEYSMLLRLVRRLFFYSKTNDKTQIYTVY